jgi:hypothetical protein
MDDPLVLLARRQLGRELARLRGGVTRTPRIDAALGQLQAATAELIAWAHTSPVREPGDSLYTPIGPWVQAVNALQSAMHPEDADAAEEVVEGEAFTPPDTPLAEWIAGVEALLDELVARDRQRADGEDPPENRP